MSIFESLNNKFRTRAGACTIAEHLRAGLSPDRDLLPGERSVGNLIIPPFQRQKVWTDEQKVRLIESIFMGLSIGGIVVNKVSDYSSPCCDLLLDGQQRMTTIHGYMSDEYEVFGKYFSELELLDKRLFRMVSLTESTSELTTIEECKELYNRLAYGGTEHKPSHYKQPGI